MSRKKLLLYILLGVSLLAAGRAVLSVTRTRETPAAPPPPRSADGAPAKAPSAPPAGEEGVRLDLLNREREPFRGTRHDLFAPLFQEKKPAPRTAMPALPPPPPLPPLPAAPAPPPPPPPPVPGWTAQQELARFTYLGFLEKKGAKTIFLSAGDEIFVVKQGDRFGRNRQFQVAQLTPDRLVVRQGEDPRPITIPLVEQAPLSPSGEMRSPSEGMRSPGGGRFGTPPPPMPGAVQEGEPLPEEDVPLPDEEPPPDEESGPFVSPGQMGSPGILRPFGQTAPQNTVPQFGPGNKQPAPMGHAMPEEVPR